MQPGSSLMIKQNIQCWMYSRDSGSQCYRLGSSMPVGTLLTGRVASAGVVIRNGTALWMAGGYNFQWEDQDTSEIIEVSNEKQSLLAESTEFVKLPRPMSYHCLEMIDDKLAILFGGEEFGHSSPIIRDSWIMDLDSPSFGWTLSPSLNIARKDHMGGSVIVIGSDQRVVIAAGGRVSSGQGGQFTNSVELLVVGLDWELGPILPMTLAMAASSTTSDKTRLFVSGGLSAITEESLAVLSFSCQQSDGGFDCAWTKHDFELMKRREYGVSFIVTSLNDLIFEGASTIAHPISMINVSSK